MECEFCHARLPDAEPQNLTLLAHVRENRVCGQQFLFMLENLNTSWTRAMSGG